MTDFYPHSFYEAAGGVVGLTALIFAFISLNEKWRTHSLRILSVFFVVSISLFSNHVGVYFASVFIIATAVTELEFLQTLAAIIRGNKEYFDYKTGTLTSEEKLRAIRAELDEMGGNLRKQKEAANDSVESVPVLAESEISNSESSSVDNILEEVAPKKVISGNQISNERRQEGVSKGLNESVMDSSPDPRSQGLHLPPGLTVRKRPDKGYLKTIVELEGKALDYVEELYGSTIGRNVLIRSGAQELELDGVIRHAPKSGRPDEIFEVKFVTSESSFDILLKLIPRIQKKIFNYTSMTKRTSVCQLVLVLDDEVSLSGKQFEELADVVYKNGLHGFHVLRSNELQDR